jgi:hypothetical protein
LTETGRDQLEARSDTWNEYAAAVAKVLQSE